MRYDALDGLDALLAAGEKKHSKKPVKEEKPIKIKPPRVKREVPDLEGRFPENKIPGSEQQIVRDPRLVPENKKKKRYEKTKQNAANGVMFGPSNLGLKKETQQRRELIVNWLLDGHTYNGDSMSVTELADAIGVPVETVENDLTRIKEQMSIFYEDQHNKEMPIFAYMLMEMKMQDRGRALSIHNQILADMAEDDTETESDIIGSLPDMSGEGGVKKSKGVTFVRGKMRGRERASMYSAALQALDIASKATVGLDNIFKMVGGPERVRAILQAKALNTGVGGSHSINNSQDLQELLMQMPEFQSALPSHRVVKNLNKPAFLEMNEQDKAVMDIGQKEYSKKTKQITLNVPKGKDISADDEDE